MEGVSRAAMLAVLLATAAASAQTVYKSTNPDGSVVYSDKPPADGRIDKVIEFAELPSSPVPDVIVQQFEPLEPGMPRVAIMSHDSRGAIARVVRMPIPGASPPAGVSSDVRVAAPPPPAAAAAPVTLFSAAWCGYCRRAKAYLADHGIAYDNVDIDTPDGREEFVAAGKGGIPLLVRGMKRVRGFKPEGYDAFFASR